MCSPSIRLQDTFIINISESDQSMSQIFCRETVSKESNSLRLHGLKHPQLSLNFPRPASGVFDHLSSE